MTTYRILIGDESQNEYFAYIDLASKRDLRLKKYRAGLVGLILSAHDVKDKLSISRELSLLTQKWGFEIVLLGFSFKKFDKNNLKIEDRVSWGDGEMGCVLKYRDGEFFISAMFTRELSNASQKVDAMAIMKDIYVGACDLSQKKYDTELLGVTKNIFSDSSILVRCLPEDE
ncbi:hypothetical protein [Photobacterium damselae]|uniref:hypothetical protein n=1 Tax=Photobacterium damselae TaxID=38293 RepID=UPI001F222F2E|nr:hypothetical protein [Photobacterium damselae]UKA04464.1 hypothetical protein IHC89_22845 [Photobacterium damselae subsp. damselae]